MISNILLVDDHPAILNGYLSVLGFNDKGIEFVPTFCYNCEDAYHAITNPEQVNLFDFIFLDRSLPPFPEKKIKSGEDLAVLAREYQNKAKIIKIGKKLNKSPPGAPGAAYALLINMLRSF